MPTIYHPNDVLITQMNSDSSSFQEEVLTSSPNSVVLFDSTSHLIAIPTQSFIPSQVISSSYSLSSSYAVSASWAPGGGISVSASWASSSISSSYAISSSWAPLPISASWASSSVSASWANFSISASYSTSASWAPDNPNAVSASWASSSISASYSISSSWAPMPTVSNSSSWASSSISSSYALSSSYSLSGSYSLSSSWANTASYSITNFVTQSTNIVSSSFASQSLSSSTTTFTPNLPVVTVSPKGIKNHLSTIINDGKDFGPDTIGTLTCGLQEAFNYFPQNNSRTGSYGGTVQLAPGVYYCSSSIQVVSQEIMEMKVIGNGLTNTAIVFSCSLNSPSQSYLSFYSNNSRQGDYCSLITNDVSLFLQDFTVAAYYDTTNYLIMWAAGSRGYLKNIGFTYWPSALNNNGWGLVTGTTGPSASPTGLSGLNLAPQYTDLVVLENCMFWYLCNGISIWQDHVSMMNCNFNFIGMSGNSWPTSPCRPTNTNWPEISAASSLGACILHLGGLGNLSIWNPIFYKCNLCIASLIGFGGGHCVIKDGRIESCNAWFTNMSPNTLTGGSTVNATEWYEPFSPSNIGFIGVNYDYGSDTLSTTGFTSKPDYLHFVGHMGSDTFQVGKFSSDIGRIVTDGSGSLLISNGNLFMTGSLSIDSNYLTINGPINSANITDLGITRITGSGDFNDINGNSFAFYAYGYKTMYGKTYYSPQSNVAGYNEAGPSDQYYLQMSWSAIPNVDGYKIQIWEDDYNQYFNGNWYLISSVPSLEYGKGLEHSASYQDPLVVGPNITVTNLYFESSSGDMVLNSNITSSNFYGTASQAITTNKILYSSSLVSLMPLAQTGSAYFQISSSTMLLFGYDGTKWRSCSLA